MLRTIVVMFSVLLVASLAAVTSATAGTHPKAATPAFKMDCPQKVIAGRSTACHVTYSVKGNFGTERNLYTEVDIVIDGYAWAPEKSKVAVAPDIHTPLQPAGFLF